MDFVWPWGLKHNSKFIESILLLDLTIQFFQNKDKLLRYFFNFTLVLFYESGFELQHCYYLKSLFVYSKRAYVSGLSLIKIIVWLGKSNTSHRFMDFARNKQIGQVEGWFFIPHPTIVKWLYFFWSVHLYVPDQVKVFS